MPNVLSVVGGAAVAFAVLLLVAAAVALVHAFPDVSRMLFYPDEYLTEKRRR